MFFNEDLYLEAEDVDATPVSDAEVDQAVAESGGFGAVPEDYNFYSETLEWMEGANDYYYNLREKMMNIEHIASLKESQGLVSESEAILTESVDSFLDKVKTVFTKIKNVIVNLFNKFVNFVSSLFVSTKDVLNMNVDQAWSKKGQGFTLKVNVLNVDPDAMNNTPKMSSKLMVEVVACCGLCTSLFDTLSKGSGTKPWRELVTELVDITIPKRLGAKIKAGRTISDMYVFSNILPQDMSQKSGIRVQTVLQKQTKEIKKDEFVKRIAYAKAYKAIIATVKANKDLAVKACDESIKLVEKAKAKTSDKKDFQGAIISALRTLCNISSKLFSKLTNLCSQYYRECIAIGKRVLGAGNAQDAKKNLKKMTEGFDYDAYFAM